MLFMSLIQVHTCSLTKHICIRYKYSGYILYISSSGFYYHYITIHTCIYISIILYFIFFLKLLSLRKWNLSDEIRKIPSPVKIIKELLSHANMFLKIVHYNFICIKMKMKRNAVESKLVQS